MAADDALWSALGRVAETPTLLVACVFDGALAAEDGDPADARAEQQSSEALNVLMALSDTTVAVVSHRPADEVAELMFLVRRQGRRPRRRARGRRGAARRGRGDGRRRRRRWSPTTSRVTAT